jgi:hypothetical protein
VKGHCAPLLRQVKALSSACYTVSLPQFPGISFDVFLHAAAMRGVAAMQRNDLHFVAHELW